MGVTLFFFISGYLITGLLIDEKDRTNTIDVGTFYIRRFMRLGPALLTMVAIVSLIYLIHFQVYSTKVFLAAVLYFTNYYEIAGGVSPVPFGPLWSLAVERTSIWCFPGDRLLLAIPGTPFLRAHNRLHSCPDLALRSRRGWCQ